MAGKTDRLVRWLVATGTVLLGAALLNKVSGDLGMAFLPEAVERALVPLGLLALGIGAVVLQRQENRFDERFVLHRLRASRAAAVVGVIGMGVWFVYDALLRTAFHWELLAILVAMAVAKVGYFAYLQQSQ